MIVKRGLRVILGALLVASLAYAGTAHAKAFTMSGAWYQNRGPLIDIPINGGPALCIGGSIKTGCVGVFKPAGGGIPGGAGISAMNAAPAAFTIPVAAFGQSTTSSRTAVAIIPTVVQLATAFTLAGPPSFAQALAAVPTFTKGQPAVFEKNAWSNDPGQTAVTTPRAAATFAWCPGVGGPLCASGLLATPAAVQGRIEYIPGVNKFGGTMGMLIKGGGAVSITAGSITIPTPGNGTFMVPLLGHLPLAGAVTFMNPQAGGVGYAFENTVMLGSAPLFIGFMTSGVGGTGLITSTGPALTTGGASMNAVVVPGDTNLNWGMPWTTGSVSVMNTELSAMGGMQTGTLTGMGTDERTAAGKGTIVMVAGGTSNRVVSGSDFEAFEVVVMNFSDGTPTPSMGPAGLATVATLMALTAGYAIRGRFARKN